MMNEREREIYRNEQVREQAREDYKNGIDRTETDYEALIPFLIAGLFFGAGGGIILLLSQTQWPLYLRLIAISPLLAFIIWGQVQYNKQKRQ